MINPITTIDERFGQPDATPTSWDDTLAILQAAEMFWVTTVRNDGRPHVTPLVAVWCDDALYFCVGADEQKTVNLRHNNHVVLTTGRETWNEGVDVVVEGVATREVSPEMLNKAAEAWTHKWDGRWDYAVGTDSFHHRDGDTVMEEDIYVFRVAPQKVFAVSRGPFSQTRHQF
jgi:nitroimidazol reductase NimA-like FMN-containing flavoprotein (pyridoxamine 5'-phosphate oxidase superfamily)